MEDQSHLFEEFWGTSTSTLDNLGSTGLGLPISKQLVEMMRGSIGFESEPERGSIFWFEIPLDSPSVETVKLEKARSSRIKQIAPYKDLPILRGRILIAEDNPANQLIGQTMLERMGLQVDVVANGREAVAAVRSIPYDLVLMDINMPEMDGIEATGAIRKLPGESSGIQIVAMTALAMPGDKERFLSQGMDGYISKPIMREELHACIASVLEDLERPPSTITSDNDTNPADTNTSIIDTEILSTLTRDVGTELLPKIIDKYLSEIPVRVNAITAAADSNDCALIAKEAHPLKSSSAYMGAMGLAELASTLEQAGLELNLEKIKQEVLHLPGLFEQTREELTRAKASETK
ncbi:MAG: response regulator [Halieaceae bacterium]|jgi:CheY-like chemotaxis protein/HPt (histidine-containing phosphotransfer) domain-containing protein|nr:response regulator [Halieaceae bacterium]